MIYDRDLSWAFIHIPKTGGTNIRMNAKCAAHTVIGDIDMPAHFNHQPLWWWREQGVIDNNTPVYSVVRNPYDRVLSLYMHVTRTREMTLEHFCFDFIHDPVHAIQAGVEWQLNWPQWRFLDSDVTVYKYETEYRALEEVFGFKYRHTRFNASNYAGVTHNKATIAWVNYHYEEDFLKYGYVRM